MSQQQPPPPPYGGPPGNYPPGNYPPGNYPPHHPGSQPPQQPMGGMSNKAKFWVGVLLALPAVALASVVLGAATGLISTVLGDYEVATALSGVLSLAMLGGFVALVVIEKTRWFAIGMLAGIAILAIVAAGACVALLVALAANYN